MPVPFENPDYEHFRGGRAARLPSIRFSTQPRLNRYIQKSKSNLLIALYLGATTFCHAEISGQISFAGEHRAQAQKESQSGLQTKQITVTSLGSTPDGAEKQAITDAVRQAVGAYIDSDTLTQNEEVIQDRILTLSAGFVKNYRVTTPAHLVDGGLYQVSIAAMVETNQVASALKAAKIIKGDLAGQNLWAEGTTKSTNAQDALILLQAKMQEHCKKLIKLQFIDAKGALASTNAPAKQTQNSDTIKATWYVRLSVDHAYYQKYFVPILVKCIQNITNSPGVRFRLKSPQKISSKKALGETIGLGIGSDADPLIPFEYNVYDYQDDVVEGKRALCTEKTMFVVERYPLNFAYLEGTMFTSDKYEYYLEDKNINSFEITLDLKTKSDELIASGIREVRAPFSLAKDKQRGRKPPGVLGHVGPFVYTEGTFLSVIGIDPVISITVDIPMNDMKKVEKIECRLEVPDFEFSIEPVVK
jgi:hypothetical protein